MILIKVKVTPKDRAQIIEIAETLKANIADVGLHTITIEGVGESSRIDTMIELLKPFGIKEIVRTGRIAMVKESKAEEK